MTETNDDARFLIKEFVMPGLEKLDRKMEAICTTQLELKITDEQMKAKIAHIELNNIRTQEDLDQHKIDMQKHYNPYYNETIPQKIWRKKPEIATGVTLSSIVMTIILKLLEVI